jgi:putative membrane protein
MSFTVKAYGSCPDFDTRRQSHDQHVHFLKIGGRAMMASGLRVTTLLTMAALVLAACSKKDDSAADTMAATNVGADTSAVPGSTASGSWTDANIFALLDEANAADSTAGAVAVTKGTASAVRDYGRRMVRDHHQLRAQGEALAKRLKIIPAVPADDPVASAAQKHMDNINSTAKGKDFDKAYIDGEVEIHKAVLEIATAAAKQTQNTELKNLIQKAAPVIQGHLDLAQSVQTTIK